MNKNLMSQKLPLTDEQIKDLIEDIDLDLFQKKKDTYFMLLCRQDNNYTLFNFKNKDYKLAKEELYLCLKNRGKVLSIQETEDKGAFEIWIKDFRDVWCYYIFPCDRMVIEV